jgi:fatty-acyl-CoA synthase
MAHCKVRLAGFKAPKYVVFVPAVARNAAGKLDKPTLRRLYGKSTG